jgi:hypothetical protein
MNQTQIFVVIRNELFIHRILTQPNFVTTLDQTLFGYIVLANYKTVSGRVAVQIVKYEA